MRSPVLTRTCNVALPQTAALKVHLMQCRSNSTTSAFPLKVPSTIEGDHTVLNKSKLKRPEHKTPNLNTIVGSAWTAKNKGIQADMYHLGAELQNIFRRIRTLETVMKSSEYVSLSIVDDDGVWC